MRNVQAAVPKASTEMDTATIRTIFSQLSKKHVRRRFGEVARRLERSQPKVTAWRVMTPGMAAA